MYLQRAGPVSAAPKAGREAVHALRAVVRDEVCVRPVREIDAVWRSFLLTCAIVSLAWSGIEAYVAGVVDPDALDAGLLRGQGQ